MSWLTDVLQSTRNRTGFAMRGLLRWQGLPYHERPFNPDSLLREFSPETLPEYTRLHQEYSLSAGLQEASRERQLETWNYLDWLDGFYRQNPEAFQRIFEASDTLRWLDVGAKNWSYVEAITGFMQAHYDGSFQVDGVELDPHRRYADLRTRGQAANYFIRHLPQATYHEGNILDWKTPADVITHFLPFVLSDPLLAWGLPKRFFQPQAILEHLIALLTPDGILLIVNQGEAEAEAQEALLKNAEKTFRIRYQKSGPLPDRFVGYRYPRFGWLCRKEP